MILIFILYGTPKYEIFSLRIDMNILSTSCSTKSILSTCPLCSREPETVKYFTLKCSRFADKREKFIGSIISHTPSFRMKDYVYQQKYILGLHCPPEAISYCCKYISTIYSLRENDEIQIHRNCVSLCIDVFCCVCCMYICFVFLCYVGKTCICRSYANKILEFCNKMACEICIRQRYIQLAVLALTHWGRDKKAAIFQTTFSNAFSGMKMFKFRLRFHWSLFQRVQLTTFHHWFR